MSSLYILNVTLLSDTWLGNNFSHPVACIFILLFLFLSFSLFGGPGPQGQVEVPGPGIEPVPLQ